jgi:hypothetical protein
LTTYFSQRLACKGKAFGESNVEWVWRPCSDDVSLPFESRREKV